ncbi:MAG: NUDIX domain-containing protein [Pseudomonadota bacterium]
MVELFKPEDWQPHLTVAAAVEKDGRFLLVEEWSRGQRVINQPAGHVEAGESIAQACVRETLEETGWRVTPTGVLAFQRWHRPHSAHTYFRVVLTASAEAEESGELDCDIIRPLWLTPGEVVRERTRLRSPLVEATINTWFNRRPYPLDVLQDWG